MDTEQTPDKKPDEKPDELEVVETSLPKRVVPSTPDPRLRREPDQRIQHPR